MARRRARVREQLLEAAERLMAARGVDDVTIDEITAEADIARRSFYHHFESKNDLLGPIARRRARDLNRAIDLLVETMDDPAEALATGIRHGLRGFTRDPLCEWLILRSGLPTERLFEGVGESGMRDAARGVETGRFHVESDEVAKRIFAGAFVAALSARGEEKLDDHDLDIAAEHLLRLLGLARDEAARMAHQRLPPLPDLTTAPAGHSNATGAVFETGETRDTGVARELGDIGDDTRLSRDTRGNGNRTTA